MMMNNPAIQIGENKVYSGHNLDILRTFDDNSVDSIVTDPPYELGFMGKGWDKSGIAYSVELWKECLRVLKPGGHLLAFGGSRTWHRLAVAIEDAGFEMRDSIAWLYGSGFPKSHNISKAIDKKPEMSNTKTFKLWLAEQISKSGKSRKEIDDECGFTACSYAKTDGKDGWSSNHPTQEKWAIMKKVIGLSDEWDWVITDNIAERGFIEPTGGLHGGTGNTVGKWEGGKQLSNNAISPDAKKWDGWGTALKPAFEPIVVARKPLIGTVAENVLQFGVGGLNIDASRIDYKDDLDGGDWNRFAGHQSSKTIRARLDGNNGADLEGRIDNGKQSGRWPANVILDETTAELLDEQTALLKGAKNYIRSTEAVGTSNINLPRKAGEKQNAYGDSGGASRFFYVAKASKRDRNEGLDELPEVRHADRNATDGVGGDNPRNRTNKAKQNFHPTVKPTTLMTYLIKLVTPPNGIVLDPFAGSGSTGKAAILEGYKFVGIELTEDYLPIIEGRLQHAYQTYLDKGDDLFA